MENFFERVGRFWPAGRRDLHWHILPTPREASALVAPYQGLARPGLQSVPVQGMHCTLLHTVGLSSTDIDTEALLKDVRTYARTVRPFTLTFDRPSVGNVGVEISGWPGPLFAKIVDTLTQTMTRTGAAFRAAPSRYPHMSLAYASEGADDVDAVALRAALAAIAHPLSGTVLVDRIHLVEQWHDGAHITWHPIAEVPLGVSA
ncbi:2'-5' RNA ligase family protein (plasmid) [Streptomyces sp. R-74717]|uniref:2'-5' RNA ligase family protein n=1 Tax=Streptomyces sp. R-74717 TaxID=2969820 RepID=UPI0039B3CC96